MEEVSLFLYFFVFLFYYIRVDKIHKRDRNGGVEALESAERGMI